MKFKKTIVPVIIYTVELRLLCCEIVYLGNKTRVDRSSYNFNFNLLWLALEKENNFLELKKNNNFNLSFMSRMYKFSIRRKWLQGV